MKGEDAIAAGRTLQGVLIISGLGFKEAIKKKAVALADPRSYRIGGGRMKNQCYSKKAVAALCIDQCVEVDPIGMQVLTVKKEGVVRA